MSETSALESAQTRAGRCSFALLAAALLACAPDYETEHLRITTHLDFPLCEGNLDSYERMIDDFEVRIGTELRAPLDVELWNDRDWRAETRRLCGPRDVIACYNTVTHRVNGAFGQEILGHEIVHALMPTAVHSDLLFYEGTAVALSSSTVLAGGRPVLTPPFRRG